MDHGTACIHQKLHTGPLQLACFEAHTHSLQLPTPPVPVDSLLSSALMLKFRPSTTCNSVITCSCYIIVEIHIVQ
uniref:Uncharacterized protein n=1 Tax=Arundo donax TaxID=35708 RepID=A0A0A9HV89_ARUDO